MEPFPFTVITEWVNTLCPSLTPRVSLSLSTSFLELSSLRPLTHSSSHPLSLSLKVNNSPSLSTSNGNVKTLWVTFVYVRTFSIPNGIVVVVVVVFRRKGSIPQSLTK